MTRKLFILILYIWLQNSTNAINNIETSLHKVEVTNTSKNAVIDKPVQIKTITNESMLEDTVEATIADRHYILYPDGKIAVNHSSSIQTDSFHLDTDLLIGEAYFFDYKENLIVYYTSVSFPEKRKGYTLKI